jgi:hypothetical protein
MSQLSRNIIARLATSAGASLVGFISSASGAVMRTLQSIFAEKSRLLDFGADPTGVADSTAAVNAWIADVFARGVIGEAGPGTFKVTQQIVMNWGLVASAGAIFRGAGINRTIFDLTAVTTAPAWLMTDTTGSDAAFYGTFSDIGFKGNLAGQVLQIGAESYADGFNSFDVKVNVNNLNTTASACAIELNGVYDSDLFLIGNCAGHGDAIRVRETQFSRFFGSGGNADTSIHLTGGYNFGNVFHAWNAEVVNTCVVIDDASTNANTWVGGQFVWSNGSGPAVAAINATAGSVNRFIGVNYGSAGSITTGSTGVIVDGKGVGSQTMGGLLVSPLSGDAVVTVDSVTTNTAGLVLNQAGVPVWKLVRGTDGTLQFVPYVSGAAQSPAAYITPSTGQMTIAKLEASTVGFFGAGVVTARPTVSGSRSGGAALTSLIGVLNTLGLITDGTTA